MRASQPKGLANNLGLSEPAPSDAPEASTASRTKAPVIPIENALESARGVSSDYSFRQSIEVKTFRVRLDWIAMGVAIGLLPIGALFVVQPNRIFPTSLAKSSAMTRDSVPLSQTQITRSLASGQGKVVLASQASVVQKSDHTRVVSDVRYSSDSTSAVVNVDLDRETQFQVHRISSPERIYLDLQNTKLAPALFGKAVQTQDHLLRALRVGEHENQTTRITLATTQICEYSVTWVPTSWQLRIELREAQAQSQVEASR